MKLKPSKCVFRVTVGKFLGFMVSQRGIEVNPEKVRAILKLEPPRIVKAVQSDVHEIYTIKYSHIYIFSLTFTLFCD